MTEIHISIKIWRYKANKHKIEYFLINIIYLSIQKPTYQEEGFMGIKLKIEVTLLFVIWILIINKI